MAKRGRTKVFTINIDRIKIPSNRRTLDADAVNALAESIKAIGQQTPITVAQIKGQLVLIAGLHRIEAAKVLGLKKVRAIRLSGRTAIDRKLWAGSENLHRAELTALERAEHINRWRRLLMKAKDAQVAQPGGKQPTDKGISRAAKQFGFSRDEVRRAEQIARISKKIRVLAVEQGLGDNQAALLKIAGGKSEDEQHNILGALRAARASSHSQVDGQSPRTLAKIVTSCSTAPSAESISGSTVGGPEGSDIPPMLVRLTPEDQEIGDNLITAWSNASPTVRKWFLGKVLPPNTDIWDFSAAIQRPQLGASEAARRG